MTLAARLAVRAASMIERWGGAATLRVPGTPVYDSATRTRTTPYTDHSVRVKADRRIWDNRDGTLVKTERLRASIAARGLPAGVVPTTDSLLDLGGETYKVLDVEASGPDPATPVTYELELGQ